MVCMYVENIICSTSPTPLETSKLNFIREREREKPMFIVIKLNKIKLPWNVSFCHNEIQFYIVLWAYFSTL